MRRLKVGVVDLLAHSVTTPFLRRRVIAPGTASVMPQAVAAWAEELGYEVHYAVFTAQEDLRRLVPEGLDVVFISAFTRAAFMAYALSRHLRSSGTVTVLGGPHAQSLYPEGHGRPAPSADARQPRLSLHVQLLRRRAGEVAWPPGGAPH